MTSKESPLVSSLEKILSKPVFQKAIAKALADSLASAFEDIQQDRADLADHRAQAAPVVGACSPSPEPAPWIPKVGERVRFTRQLASQPDWIVLGLWELPYVHLTRASDGVPSGGYVWSLEPAPKYRTPTLADLAQGAIECEVRDRDSEDWQKRWLVFVSKYGLPFRTINRDDRDRSGGWDQCRIEDLPETQTQTQTQTQTGFPVSVIQMPQPPEGWRLLGKNEVLRKGDKRFNVHGKAWDLERRHIGDLVSDSFNTRFIRRNTFDIGERVVVVGVPGYENRIYRALENSKITPPSIFGMVCVACERNQHRYEFCTDVLAPYFEDSK